MTGASHPAVVRGRRALPGKICIAIQAESPEQMRERATEALAEAHFLEFRLDSLRNPSSALPGLREFLAAHPEAAAIATCRRTANGGRFDEPLAAQLATLKAAAAAGCRIVDLEVESAEEATPEALESFRRALQAADAELLISFHDFKRTPDVEEAFRRAAGFAPAYVKVVATAHTLADNLPVLQLLHHSGETTKVVAIAMGEEGLPSRVLGPCRGGAFTFASLGDGAETAPGQVTAQAMRELYRAESLNADTRIFAVAGNPIAHSLSPRMHNTAFRQEGVNAVLLPLRVLALSDLLTLMKQLPVHGAAVTMPLKVQVLPHLAHMDPLTARIGACNTLRVDEDGKLHGFNTDVAGVLQPLSKRITLKGARIAVLGAGGAARAAVFGLVDAGADVFVVNRTPEHAASLAAEAQAFALRQEQLRTEEFDVLINATPCGMAGSDRPLPLEESELRAGLVFDMVYNPLETPLLRLARARGVPVIGGIEMFVQQGVQQFELWTGRQAPEAAMRMAVEQALATRA